MSRGRRSTCDKVVEIRAGVDAHVREELKAIEETVQKNHVAVQPTLEEWRHMKKIRCGISGVIAFAGLTIGGLLAWAGDVDVARVLPVIRHTA